MSQGGTYERQNLKNFRCKCRDYLYNPERISSSKHKNCQSQRTRKFDYIVNSVFLKYYITKNIFWGKQCDLRSFIIFANLVHSFEIQYQMWLQNQFFVCVVLGFNGCHRLIFLIHIFLIFWIFSIIFFLYCSIFVSYIGTNRVG